MRTLRLFVDHKRARLALWRDVPDDTVISQSDMRWIHPDGSETWFRPVDSRLEGIEWSFISYDEAGPITGEMVARLEAMRRLSTASDISGPER